MPLNILLVFSFVPFKFHSENIYKLYTQ
jgi:hypothetical protein